jgi:hypothetical protein
MTTALEGGEGSALRPGCSLPPGKNPVPIVQETEWAPGPFWTGAENLVPTGIQSPDRPARSQSLYRLSYPAHGTNAEFSHTELRDRVVTTVFSRAPDYRGLRCRTSYQILLRPILVAARSTAWVCGRLLAGIAGSNPAGIMDVCLLCV